MLEQKKPKKLISLLVLAFFFAAGYFYSGFRNSPKPSISALKTMTEDTHAESVLTKYYPLQKGNYWEYEGEKREDQGGGQVVTERVTRKVEVLDTIATPDGIEVKLDGESNHLIKGNNVYSRQSWGDELVLQFPLYVGQKWGDEDSLRYRDDNSYVWYVEEKFSKLVLGKNYDECFKISYKTNPDSSYFVFCYGLGVVEDAYKHNGTVLEWNSKLTGTNVGK